MPPPRGVASLVRLELHSYSLQELSRAHFVFEKFGARGALVRQLLDPTADDAGPQNRGGLRVGDCVLHAELLRPTHTAAASGEGADSGRRVRLLIARPYGSRRFLDTTGLRPKSLLLPSSDPPPPLPARPAATDRDAMQRAPANEPSHGHHSASALLSPVEEPVAGEPQSPEQSSQKRSTPLHNYYLEARHRIAPHRQAHVFDVLVERSSNAEQLGMLIAAYSFVDVRSGGASVVLHTYCTLTVH